MAHPHHGHRERLRQRLQTEGLDNFQPHEVLELLLSYVIPRRNVNPLAHALVDHFGSLQNVLNANVEELTEFPMMGPKAAIFLKTIGQQVRTYSTLEDRTPVLITNVEAAVRLTRISSVENRSAKDMAFCLGSAGELLASLMLAPLMSDDARMRRLAEICVTQHIYHLVWVCFENELRFVEAHFNQVRALGRFLSSINVQLIDFLLINQESHLSMRIQGHLVAQQEAPESLFFRWLM